MDTTVEDPLKNTLIDGEHIDKNCPHCGGPLKEKDNWEVCNHCHTTVEGIFIGFFEEEDTDLDSSLPSYGGYRGSYDPTEDECPSKWYPTTAEYHSDYSHPYTSCGEDDRPNHSDNGKPLMVGGYSHPYFDKKYGMEYCLDASDDILENHDGVVIWGQ